jgi:membrane associated rhomboid family serine protease
MFIPVNEKITARTFPYCTAVLVLINLFVFIAFQQKDDLYIRKAYEYYFKSGLAEIEYQAYQRHTGQNASTDISSPQGMMKVMEMQRDQEFAWKLWQGEIITNTHPDHERWKSVRQEFQNLKDKSIASSLGFVPAEPQARSLLTYMFLHGGWMHLLGNMVFLWLSGCLLEQARGRIAVLTTYLLGGCAAAGAFWALNAQGLIALVGASGSISALMGALTVAYGMRKIKVFLALGFYFNYFRMPAIALLPFWIGNELYQHMQYGDSSNVAYMAHFGGLLGGAILGLAVKKLSPEIPHRSDDTPVADPAQELLQSAIQHIRQLEFGPAREMLEEAIRISPNHLHAHRQLYILDKSVGNPEKLRQSGETLLRMLAGQNENNEAINVYEELRSREVKLHDPDILCALFPALMTASRLDLAEEIATKMAREHLGHPALPALLLQFGHKLNETGHHAKAAQCMRFLVTRLPHAEESGYARQELEAMAGPSGPR